MLADDPTAFGAGCARGEDILLLAQRKNLPADQTRHRDPIQHGKDDEQADHVAAELAEHRSLNERIQHAAEYRCKQNDHQHVGQ